MAKIEFKDIKKYNDLIDKLGQRGVGIIKQAVYDGAAIAIENVKTSLRSVVKNGNGDLERSTYLTEMENKNGYIYTKIDFADYDRNQHPNRLKANALESGTKRGQRKTPFIRPAMDRCKKAVETTMDETLNKKIQEIMKG